MDPSAPRSAVVQFLSDRDAPCARCGYNLRGVQSEVCPECGSTVQLEVVQDRSVVSGRVVYLATAILAGHAGVSAWLLVEYGTSSVMSAVSRSVVVSVFVTHSLQILMVCTGGAISVMARRESRALASRRLIAWTMAVVAVNTFGTVLYAFLF